MCSSSTEFTIQIGNLLGDSCHPVSTSRNIPWGDDLEDAGADAGTPRGKVVSEGIQETAREVGASDGKSYASKQIMERISFLNDLGATVVIPSSAIGDAMSPSDYKGSPLVFKPRAASGTDTTATSQIGDPFDFSSAIVRNLQHCAGVRRV